MAITEQDILVMASERLTDDPDGGGRMSAVVVQSGVENNLFNDVSSVDRAQGAFHLRKAWGWVNSTGHEPLLGAHLILDALAADTDVSAVLIPATAPGDKRADMVAWLNVTNAATTRKFCGTKTLQLDAATGDRTLHVDGIETQLIPLGRSGAAVSGSIAAGASTVTGLVVAGATAAVDDTGVVVFGTPVYAVARVDAQINKAVRAVPGSLAATGNAWTDAAGTLPVAQNPIAITNSSATGLLANDKGLVASTFDWGTWLNDPFISVRGRPAPGDVGLIAVLEQSSNGGSKVTISGSYQPGLLADVPREEQRLAVDSANQNFVYNFTLPAGTLPGTESVRFTSGGVTRTLRTDGTLSVVPGAGFGTSDFKESSGAHTASINRFSGALAVVLATFPDLDSEIVVTYGRASAAASISSAALSGGGNVDGSGHLTVTLTAGRTLESFAFYIGTTGYAGIGGSVYTFGNVVGAYDKATGVISLALTSGAVTDWRGVEVDADAGVLNVTTTLAPGLDPAGIVVTGTTTAAVAFSATSNGSGAFATAIVTGSYAPATGVLALVFSEGVKSGTLAYTADQITYSPTGLDLGGLVPSNYPATGKVQVLRPLDLVVAHREITVAPATYVNTDVVTIGAPRISRLRVIDSTGAVIATFVYGAAAPVFGASADMTAGTLTFTDVSAMSQPLTLKALIADMTTVSTVASDGTVKLSRALTHDYPTGSLLSSALLAGDTFSQVHDGFAQATWSGVFSDALIGSAPSADYNEIVNPIQVTNEGAITERWAIIFTAATTFRVVGESVGEILTGSTGTPTAPLNPASLVPYFTIPAAGWGSGWAIGNVYRFNTDSATFPFWVARTVMPSDQVTTVDSITVAVRGDIDNS